MCMEALPMARPWLQYSGCISIKIELTQYSYYEVVTPFFYNLNLAYPSSHS